MKKGLTIIETMIYISLLSLLTVSAFTSAYSLVESAQNLQGKNRVQDEGNFVIQKIRSVLANAQGFSLPSQSNPKSSSAVINQFDGSVIVIQKNGSSLEISREGLSGTFNPLTTSNVEVTAVEFSYITPIAGGPAGLSILVTMSGSTFFLTSYARK